MSISPPNGPSPQLDNLYMTMTEAQTQAAINGFDSAESLVIYSSDPEFHDPMDQDTEVAEWTQQMVGVSGWRPASVATYPQSPEMKEAGIASLHNIHVVKDGYEADLTIINQVGFEQVPEGPDAEIGIEYIQFAPRNPRIPAKTIVIGQFPPMGETRPLNANQIPTLRAGD